MGTSLTSEERRERQREAAAKWKAKNRERCKEYLREWRAANPDKATVWYHAHKEKSARDNATWMRDNKEHRRAYAVARNITTAALKRARYAKDPSAEIKAVREWQKANPDVGRAITARRRAAKLNATPKWLTAEHHAQIRAIYAEAVSSGAHVDHIVPLQGETVCGLHVPWNLQALDPTANMRKGNRLLEIAA